MDKKKDKNDDFGLSDLTEEDKQKLRSSLYLLFDREAVDLVFDADERAAKRDREIERSRQMVEKSANAVKNSAKMVEATKKKVNAHLARIGLDPVK